MFRCDGNVTKRFDSWLRFFREIHKQITEAFGLAPPHIHAVGLCLRGAAGGVELVVSI
jgi:hypothetical protein